MDKKYIELFKELAHATEISAEQVMQYDHEKGDTEGEKTAQIMRDDYTKLYDKIRANDFDGNLTKGEFAKLLVGAMIMTNQLQDRISALKKAMTGYQTDVIPKLQKIIDEAKDDDEAMKMANESLIITES